MNKKLTLLTLATLFAVSVFAQNITEETTWTDENVPALSSGSQIYIDDTLNWQVSETKVAELSAIRVRGDKGFFNMTEGKFNATYFWVGNDTSTNAKATLSNNVYVSSANLGMGGYANTNATFNLEDSSTFVGTGTANIGNASGSTSVMNITDSATADFQKQINIGSGGQGKQSGGKATVNLSSDNAKLIMRGSINFLGAYETSGELNVSAGTLSSDGATGKVARLTVGFTSDGTMNLTGGKSYISLIDVGNWLIHNNVKSVLNVSGANTSLDVTTLNVGLNSDNGSALDSVAEVNLSNLSTVKIGNASFYDTGKLKINVDASSKEARAASIAVDGNLILNTSLLDNENFVIDFINIDKEIAGLANGDKLSVNLFSVAGVFSVNGTTFDESGSISDFLEGNVKLLNESGLFYWEDLDTSNFAWDNDTNTLSVLMTYKGGSIPEPSTYAAIFGVLALGFAAYRKRK